MSDLFIFAVGGFISLLCVGFVVLSFREVKRIGDRGEQRDSERRTQVVAARAPLVRKRD